MTNPSGASSESKATYPHASTRDLLRGAGELLAPYTGEIARAWAREYVRMQGERWLGPELETICRSHAEGFVEALRSGTIEPFLAEMGTLGRRAAEGGLSFDNLCILIHYLENGYMEHIFAQLSGEELASSLVALDFFMHRTISRVTTSYYENVRDRLSEEIAMGKALQKALLPDEVSAAGADIGLFYGSATEHALIGGDFYAVAELPDGRIALAVGDVAGKGIKAGALAAMAKHMFQAYSLEDPAPAQVLGRLNTAMCAYLPDDRFVTMVHALYDPKTGEARYASAGHPRPLLLAQGEAALITASGAALGLVPGETYDEHTVGLGLGDALVFYTDGVIEAKNFDGELFGEDGLLACCSEQRGAGGQALADTLYQRCLQYSGARLTDDIAILVLRRPREPLASDPA